ncbi:MAG: hypothetical protein LR015_00410 [Verrucomicrobia bacterium]|nr:hypothetical protein [Verrucomicrobiota bacterium]
MNAGWQGSEIQVGNIRSARLNVDGPRLKFVTVDFEGCDTVVARMKAQRKGSFGVGGGDFVNQPAIELSPRDAYR